MSDVKESIRARLLHAGACKAGFAAAGPVEATEDERYNRWIDRGCHGEMSYLERYSDIRRDPRLLLDGTQTVISCAFDYRQPKRHPLFADYALGSDYHNVIRNRLTNVATFISETFGGNTRICIDTAPIHERYWAANAGVGLIGLNGQLIVDGIGSKVFLAEILWTEAVEPDSSRLGEHCAMCGACIKACPGHALDGNGGMDARQCNSYLTIEYRGALPEGLTLSGCIYGCDICQDVCPHNNNNATTDIDEFLPSAELYSLSIDDIRRMDSAAFKQIFRQSAVRRTKLTGLIRNARNHKNK